MEDELQQLVVRKRRARRQQAGLLCLGPHSLAVDAAAVVGDGDDHLGARLAGGQDDAARGGLAGRLAQLGGLQAVVGGVADQVDQRVGEALDHRLVQLGGLALGGQFDGLAGIARQVVDQAAKAAEQLGHGHHAHHHHGVAQLARQALDLLGHRTQLSLGATGRDLLQPRLGDHQLAHPVHQLVQAAGRHAHRVGAAPGLAVGGGGRRSFGGFDGYGQGRGVRVRLVVNLRRLGLRQDRSRDRR